VTYFSFKNPINSLLNFGRCFLRQRVLTHFLFVQVRTYIHTHISIRVYEGMLMYVHVCVCVRKCMYVCRYVCVYMSSNYEFKLLLISTFIACKFLDIQYTRKISIMLLAPGMGPRIYIRGCYIVTDIKEQEISARHQCCHEPQASDLYNFLYC
jgi:hypothetical protein